jgi:hypothetical protein
MMRGTMLALASASLALAGCNAEGSRPPEELPAMPAGECKAEAAQDMIGQKATAEIGAELLHRTGARNLRWVPPRSAVTMDYRADRLTVGYDDAYTIVRISCG